MTCTAGHSLVIKHVTRGCTTVTCNSCSEQFLLMGTKYLLDRENEAIPVIADALAQGEYAAAVALYVESHWERVTELLERLSESPSNQVAFEIAERFLEADRLRARRPLSYESCLVITRALARMRKGPAAHPFTRLREPEAACRRCGGTGTIDRGPPAGDGPCPSCTGGQGVAWTDRNGVDFCARCRKSEATRVRRGIRYCQECHEAVAFGEGG